MRLKGVVALDNEPLYDRITLPSTLSAGEYTFFTIQKTQQDTVAGTNKTLVDTNMSKSGELPDPEQFECKALSLIPDFDATRGDVKKVWNETVYEIRLSGAPAHRQPTRTVTSGTGFAATDITSTTVGAPQPQAIYVLSESLLVEKGMSFSAVLIVASAQSLGGNLKVMNVLHGFHAKGVGKQG